MSHLNSFFMVKRVKGENANEVVYYMSDWFAGLIFFQIIVFLVFACALIAR